MIATRIWLARVRVLQVDKGHITHSKRFIQSRGYAFKVLFALCTIQSGLFACVCMCVIDWTRIRMNFNFYWNGYCAMKLHFGKNDENWNCHGCTYPSQYTHIDLINYFIEWFSRVPLPSIFRCCSITVSPTLVNLVIIFRWFAVAKGFIFFFSSIRFQPWYVIDANVFNELEKQTMLTSDTQTNNERRMKKKEKHCTLVIFVNRWTYWSVVHDSQTTWSE